MSMDYRKNKMLFKNLKYLIVENNQEEDDKVLKEVYSAVLKAVSDNRTSFDTLGFDEASIKKTGGLMHVTLEKPTAAIKAQLLAGAKLSDEQIKNIDSKLKQILGTAYVSDSNDYKIGAGGIQIIPSKEELQVSISFTIEKNNSVKNNIDKTPV